MKPARENLAGFIVYMKKQRLFYQIVRSRTYTKPITKPTTKPTSKAVPSRTTWRGLWCPANLRAKRFRATGRSGYIPLFWGERAWVRGGALFGKRDGVIRKNWNSKETYSKCLLSEKPIPYDEQQSKQSLRDVPSKTILRPKRVEPFFLYLSAFVPLRTDEGATPFQSVPSYPLGNQIAWSSSYKGI